MVKNKNPASSEGSLSKAASTTETPWEGRKEEKDIVSHHIMGQVSNGSGILSLIGKSNEPVALRVLYTRKHKVNSKKANKSQFMCLCGAEVQQCSI